MTGGPEPMAESSQLVENQQCDAGREEEDFKRLLLSLPRWPTCLICECVTPLEEMSLRVCGYCTSPDGAIWDEERRRRVQEAAARIAGR